MGVGIAVPYRLGVAFVGFYATWWVGLIVGAVIGSSAVFLYTGSALRHMIVKALGLNLLFAITFAFVGFVAGKYFINVPANIGGAIVTGDIMDLESFVNVGLIHYASYIGGLVGLVVASIWVIRRGLKLMHG